MSRGKSKAKISQRKTLITIALLSLIFVSAILMYISSKRIVQNSNTSFTEATFEMEDELSNTIEPGVGIIQPKSCATITKYTPWTWWKDKVCLSNGYCADGTPVQVTCAYIGWEEGTQKNPCDQQGCIKQFEEQCKNKCTCRLTSNFIKRPVKTDVDKCHYSCSSCERGFISTSKVLTQEEGDAWCVLAAKSKCGE